MYFVDREKIETTLVFLEQQFAFFEEIKELQSQLEKAAMERTCQLIIEAILDVGNAMIDGFIMRDPGSYDDIVDILDDEKVIHDELTKSCKHIIKYRKMLVQNYTEVNHEEVKAEFSNHLSVLKQFPEKVRLYLLHELGPVSAFRN
ncbi:DUF86 domain-containing protein [Bacillus sp. DTU_2020_1000418_1_SI_GHA_SEK_038]|uniref:type VII toxin-antitoxin system HepT family RNase toxin n=1 Tax=Bacillus sp. DTU_2020_1000418_1_SI_GHA_SEK_038 TaxID=3077585 RepID=UPI0028E7FB84|nr:DUF86 domain-containing protein [Bacillus sp. DTU_2020_1000418_1_SI_GHA_SEK_038]WNS74833.1 DUF86 domain-containing protein [Bacillus sp. DTU_2020_1000418_1_SI_GHA_SEK_038]